MKKDKTAKGGKKSKLIILIVIILIVLILGGVVFSFLFTKDAPAILYIEQGAVQVSHGNSWVDASDEMTLEKGDSVKTLADGKASIVFFDSSLMRLKENSEVSIDELLNNKIKLTQKAGETWNKVEHLGGVTNYEVSTPTTVATVRGTGFLVEMNRLLVDEGTVNYGFINKEGKPVSAGHKMLADIKSGKLSLKELSPEDRAKLRAHIIRDLNVLKRVRQNIAKRDKGIRIMIKMAKSNDTEMNDFFKKIDEGKVDEKEAFKRLPIKSIGVKRIILLNKRIKKYQNILRQSNNRNITNSTQ